ncbi:MAG TPA: hypothetical protein VMA83_02010 [Solirubrobacteraceae bacterium]|nr:hypothetical protein [Solirubrobacteraceae bacterium]
MATLAFMLAIGGSAYAATRLPANSVGTRQLKRGAVTRAKIGKGAVGAAQVAPGSLTGAQIKASTLGPVPDANDLGGLPASAFGATSWNSVDFAPSSEEEKTLLTDGPLTITSKCISKGGSRYLNQIYVVSTVAASIEWVADTNSLVENAALDVWNWEGTSGGRTEPFTFAASDGKQFAGILGFSVGSGTSGGCADVAAAFNQS